jgi:hypothetical protein
VARSITVISAKLFDVIDDEHIHGARLRFQFEAELLLEALLLLLGRGWRGLILKHLQLRVNLCSVVGFVHLSQ